MRVERQASLFIFDSSSPESLGREAQVLPLHFYDSTFASSQRNSLKLPQSRGAPGLTPSRRCRVLIRIFLHRRRRRFYAARHSEARASVPFLPFSSSAAESTPQVADQMGIYAVEVYALNESAKQ